MSKVRLGGMNEPGQDVAARTDPADQSILPSRRRSAKTRAATTSEAASRLANLALAVPVTGRGAGLAVAAATLLAAGWVWGSPPWARPPRSPASPPPPSSPRSRASTSNAA
jgi:hypothetical protein